MSPLLPSSHTWSLTCIIEHAVLFVGVLFIVLHKLVPSFEYVDEMCVTSRKYPYPHHPTTQS